jgi:predicted Zn finger-like uncharacterized protein
MIIQCEQCETIYRFDPSLLQNGEAQVRCIRCGNIFRIDFSSDLGEDFLETETPHTAAPTSTQSLQQSLSDLAEPQTRFSSDEITSENRDEEDFWSSPGEFSLDTSDSEADTDSLLKPEASRAADTSSANEFIFKPLDDETGVAESTERTDEDQEQRNITSPAAKPGKDKKPPRKKKGSKLLLLLLLIILLVAGIYAYYFVAYGVTSVPQLMNKAEEQINSLLNPPPETAGPSIDIQTGENFYITNEHLGSLFVVNGKVTNISRQPQGEIAVVASLYSSDGTALKSIKVYCGNTISKESLRTHSLAQLQERMANRLGAGLSNVSVQPGESIPFCAIFHDLPDDFAEFSISEAPVTTPDR